MRISFSFRLRAVFGRAASADSLFGRFRGCWSAVIGGTPQPPFLTPLQQFSHPLSPLSPWVRSVPQPLQSCLRGVPQVPPHQGAEERGIFQQRQASGPWSPGVGAPSLRDEGGPWGPPPDGALQTGHPHHAVRAPTAAFRGADEAQGGLGPLHHRALKGGKANWAARYSFVTRDTQTEKLEILFLDDSEKDQHFLTLGGKSSKLVPLLTPEII